MSQPAGVTSSTATRWRLRISAVVWFVLLVGFLLCLPVLLEASWVIVAALAVLALVLAFPASWAVRRLFRGQRDQRFRTSYLKAFLAAFMCCGIILAAPIFYLALLPGLRPMTVPQATLSNGSKTVVFQGMMHVGSEGFYKGVVYDLEKALSEGYVLYHEGVRPSPEGDQWFSDTLAGGGDLSTNYSLLSDVCGLRFQLDYFQFLAADMAARPDRHVVADVTTADMMHEYQRLVAADPAFAQEMADEAAHSDEGEANGLAGLVQWIKGATPSQKSLVGTLCRGYFTWALGGPTEPSSLDPIILDFRNRKLVERLQAETNLEIYVTYGAEHLPGVLQQLRDIDPAWEIKSIKWMRAIEAPEELSGDI